MIRPFHGALVRIRKKKFKSPVKASLLTGLKKSLKVWIAFIHLPFSLFFPVFACSFKFSEYFRYYYIILGLEASINWQKGSLGWNVSHQLFHNLLCVLPAIYLTTEASFSKEATEIHLKTRKLWMPTDGSYTKGVIWLLSISSLTRTNG